MVPHAGDPDHLLHRDPDLAVQDDLPVVWSAAALRDRAERSSGSAETAAEEEMISVHGRFGMGYASRRPWHPALQSTCQDNCLFSSHWP